MITTQLTKVLSTIGLVTSLFVMSLPVAQATGPSDDPRPKCSCFDKIFFDIKGLGNNKDVLGYFNIDNPGETNGKLPLDIIHEHDCDKVTDLEKVVISFFKDEDIKLTRKDIDIRNSTLAVVCPRDPPNND